jgi:hypothetical protein
MNSFAQALFSLFKRPVPMSTIPEEASHIFNPTANLDPSLLVHLLLSWAKADPQPTSILCDLRVISIMHSKMPQSPEHEYLVVNTEDRDKTSRTYILERTVDPSLGTVPGEARVTGVKAVKQLCASVTTSSSGSSDLASVEEGLAHIDRVTMSTVQAANIVSDSILDSLDKMNTYQAVDRFLGQGYVYARGWHGQNLRLLKPSRPLSLFQLAIIAKVVHNQFGTYDVLKESCYFHAGVIYSVVRRHFGSASPEQEDPKSGRFLGFKVQAVNPEDVERVLGAFKEEYRIAMKNVSVSFFRFN